MVRCTIYAQIYVLWEQDTIILLSPQWGSNSKAASIELAELYIMGFRPRNGGRKWYGVPFTHRYVYPGEKIIYICMTPQWWT